MKKLALPWCMVVLLWSTGCSTATSPEKAEAQWLTYSGNGGPGAGKKIVLVSGDEEYRSEEALPMLAELLASKYGFTCTVLFSVDPVSGKVDARQLSNIPGLNKLDSADLMVIFTRFRELPRDQMQHIDNYLMAGKPVIGLRTATHAFHYAKNPDDEFARYDFQSSEPGWENGFGKLVLGETWVSHHGDHGKEGTRGVVSQENASNPILNGVVDIWGPTDVYTVGPLDDADVLVYGQSTSGMTAEAPINEHKTVMPIAWTRNYTLPGGQTGKAFTTTMGASIDLQSEDLRRLLVNACFWATGLEEQIPQQADVAFISPYEPTMFGFDNFKGGRFPADYR